MNNFILIGFDRSGTSAISRTLSQHPEIELIFRPFNSGPIREKMYQILDNVNTSKDDKTFFEKLQKEELYSEYFVSQWHKKFSTVQDTFEKDKLHVIITNINHFSVNWVKNEYPGIEQWAIWRNPSEILNSCIKNEFYGSWYTDALSQIIKAVKEDEDLNFQFGKWIDIVTSANYTIKTAFLIAVRNYFLFKNIEPYKIINYDIFKINPNKALQHVLEYFGLSYDFDFSDSLLTDLNSIPSKDGYKINKKPMNVVSLEDGSLAMQIFAPLINIYNLKLKK